MDGSLGLFGSQSNQNQGKEVENECWINFDQDAILGVWNDILERQEIFDDVEEDFDLPALRIKLENKWRGEGV